MPGGIRQYPFCNIVFKFNQQYFRLRVGKKRLLDPRKLSTIQPPHQLVVDLCLDGKRHRGIHKPTQRLHGLVPLHLAATGVIAFAHKLHQLGIAHQRADPLWPQQLEAGKAGQIRPALHADLLHLHHGIVIVGQHADAGVCFFDAGDHVGIIVAVVRLLPGQLHQCAGQFRVLGNHCFKLVRVVKICPHHRDFHHVQ
ncbi:hypothetical protein SDC9_161893 [bioreactor metagenome]|uniref:Uncharacterized protein n=1 Tax=bioreactor metagenome TaxID=1076179 RepID=A0A645FLL7_9ZZZZ